MGEELNLANEIIRILDKRGKADNIDAWVGFQNSNGVGIGEDIERLILKAKKIIKKRKNKKVISVEGVK